jgi:hypothetical protein
LIRQHHLDAGLVKAYAVPSTVASTALPKHSGNSAGSCGTLATTLISWAETKLTKRHSSAFVESCGFPALP